MRAGDLVRSRSMWANVATGYEGIIAAAGYGADGESTLVYWPTLCNYQWVPERLLEVKTAVSDKIGLAQKPTVAAEPTDANDRVTFTPLWYVYVPNSGPPRHQHPDEASAVAEAHRLVLTGVHSASVLEVKRIVRRQAVEEYPSSEANQ